VVAEHQLGARREQDVQALGGVRADPDRVAGVDDRVAALAVDRGQRRLQRRQVRVDVGEDADPDRQTAGVAAIIRRSTIGRMPPWCR
jgi:hypothetical protein